MGKASLAIGIYFGEDDLIMARVRGNFFGVLENQDNEKMTPAVIYMTEDHEPVVGKMAISYSERDPQNGVFLVQRLIGRDYFDPILQDEIAHAPYHALQTETGDLNILLRGRNYSIVELVSFLLASLKRDAESATDQTVTQAVLTVPAHFGYAQKVAVRDAAQKAGLTVTHFIDEPKAVALAYGINNESEAVKTVLTYDLTGRSFAATVLSVGTGSFHILARSGDMHLGGNDIDQIIIDWMIEQARLEYHVDLDAWKHDPEIMSKVKKYAEQARLKLTRTTRTQILIPSISSVSGRPVSLNYELSRDEFNALIHPCIDRSMDLVNEALHSALVKPEEIDTVLVTGNAASLPLVQQRLQDLFDERVRSESDLLIHAKAIGAAIETLVPAEELQSQPEDTPRPLPARVPPPQEPEEIEPVEVEEEAPAAPPQPVLCSCGVLNPAGRTTCCFCGQGLGVQAPVKMGKKPHPAPQPQVPPRQPEPPAPPPAGKEPAMVDTDETWMDLDGTMMHSGDEEE